MNNYVEKIRRGDSLTNFHDVELRETVDNINRELSTDTTTIEGNPLNFTTLSAQTAKSTILSLEPIQDLHGYDKPWVGGAEKNLLPLTKEQIYAGSQSDVQSGATWNSKHTVMNYRGITWSLILDSDDNVIGIKVNGTSTGRSVLRIANRTDSSAWHYNGGYYVTKGNTSEDANKIEFRGNYYDGTDVKGLFVVVSEDFGYFSLNSISYNVGLWLEIPSADISVSDVFIYPMIRLTSETDSSFVPYTNKCSIIGRTEMNILGCGKNIFDKDHLGTNQNRYLNAIGDEMTPGGAAIWRYSDYIKVTPSATYILKGYQTMGTSAPSYCFYDKYKNFVAGYTYGQSLNKTLTIPSNVHYVRFSVEYNSLDTCQLEKDNQSTEYESYTNSNDLTISLGQTVYGGTLDVENGVLVVDRIARTINDAIFGTWRAHQTYNTVYVTDASSIDKAIGLKNIFGSCYSTSNATSVADIQNGEVRGHASNTSIYIRDDNYVNDATAFVNARGNEQLCYELATPITIQLTPHTINLLKGVNNISTDGDKITLTYRNGKFATLDGAVPKMTFRGEDYTMGVDDIGLFLKNLTKSTKTYIADPLLNFDGTVATYKKIMKQWFINNGVNIMDSTGITYLCERWYEITKQGWKGGTSFPAVGVSTGSTGTRFDDNVGMSVTPSTDTSANTDTYQGLPLFAITDCNWELDSDGNILITAIDGITDNFVRDDPTKFVGVMQQTGWVKKVDDATTQKYYYADDKDAYEDLVPLPEAIKLDGTVRSFVVHAKYMSGIVDSKMTCCSGVIPRRNISHDSLVTLPDNIGTQYSGGTSVDWSFLVWMQRIKYASLTSDGVLQGCCNYNYQYYVKVSETGVKRLILSSANGANLKVGSTVTFGAYAGNADRGQAATYSISGQDGAIITSIEDVTIDGTTYKAVYVDTTSTFDTVANGDATNGTTIVSTHHWISGTCDTVKGNDGSPVSATNGVYPAKLQGIEFMVGGYEVMADVIMNISGGYYNPYYARKSTDQATSITSSMVQSTLKCAQPSSDAWRYIQKHGFDGEIFYPVLTGTSSSEYMKDGFYENGTSTSTGTREWLGFGDLGGGSGVAGLSCLRGFGLGYGWWYFVVRLSCNGNRGILLTA